VVNSDFETTIRYWTEQHLGNEFWRREWQYHPFALEMRRALQGGRDRVDWFIHTRLKGRKVQRALGIGVGLGTEELQFVERGAVEHFEMIDVNPAGLDVLKERAAQLGIADRVTCRVQDANSGDLGERRYDLIVFTASLHHMVQLEKVLRACERALVPGGLLLASEYIGPDCFQFPAEHIAVGNAFYRTLDPRAKNKWYPDALGFPTREEVLANDPTESVHASRIVSTIRGVWPDMEFIGTYGALAFMVSWCLDYDAIYDSEIGRNEMQRLIDADHEAVDSGRLPHYYAHLIARNPHWPWPRFVRSIRARLRPLFKSLGRNAETRST
jgi:SAM-dependent methyltransferase